jgi:hypothetical protein
LPGASSASSSHTDKPFTRVRRIIKNRFTDSDLGPCEVYAAQLVRRRASLKASQPPARSPTPAASETTRSLLEHSIVGSAIRPARGQMVFVTTSMQWHAQVGMKSAHSYTRVIEIRVATVRRIGSRPGVVCNRTAGAGQSQPSQCCVVPSGPRIYRTPRRSSSRSSSALLRGLRVSMRFRRS